VVEFGNKAPAMPAGRALLAGRALHPPAMPASRALHPPAMPAGRALLAGPALLPIRYS